MLLAQRVWLEPAEEFKGGNRCIFIVRWKNKGLFFVGAFISMVQFKMCDTVLMCKYRDAFLKAEDLEVVRYCHVMT